jgi:hypothetical protein
MKASDIDNLSLEEARERLKLIYGKSEALVYLALLEQQVEMANQIRNVDYDIKEKDDQDVIDLIVKLSEKGEKIQDSMQKMLTRIDPEIMREAKNKRLGVKEGSVESFAIKKK